MAVLRHSVTVLAVGPELVDALASLLCDVAESTRARGTTVLMPDGQPVPDLRLVKGRHLRAGARYEIGGPGDAERMALRVREWRRTAAVEVEQAIGAPDLNARLTLRLAAPDRPRLFEARGRMWGPEGSGALRRGSGRARIELGAWWSAAALPPGAPPAARAPATARLRHPLGEARLHLRPRDAGDGRWLVEAAASVRGRWLLRPVAAVALLLAGGQVRRGFRDAVEQAAEHWNAAVAGLLEQGVDGVREELARQLAEGRPERDGSAKDGSKG
ncbi:MULTISPECIES: hypothetical protein [unclassified Streptomyces]|uniref:hypothetical protein n=1 Tax=unclassified Streptomyces TaxID=2593676 RepID=UPI000DACCB4F|nr:MULTISPECIES: hypothetical protein [unclassified Streptomyces]PZT76236.1 hypothetical protein DNK56_23040 [Streptomyces sp. AC1-42W]PZT79811.1 hypothetical protein DNK55_09650 [Streptomyces sp. AC1-42T]